MQLIHPVFKTCLSLLLCSGIALAQTGSPAKASEDEKPAPAEAPNVVEEPAEVAPPAEAKAPVRPPAFSRVWELLTESAPTVVNDDVLAEAVPSKVRLEVSLKERLLRMFVGEREAMSCPISCGNVTSPTKAGEFQVSSIARNATIPDRGNYVRGKSEIVVADIDRRFDPMPAGTRFQPAPVAVVICLGEGGACLQSGLATRTGTTRGDIRLPATAAETLAKYVQKGTPAVVR